jgi:hypothetical protein
MSNLERRKKNMNKRFLTITMIGTGFFLAGVTTGVKMRDKQWEYGLEKIIKEETGQNKYTYIIFKTRSEAEDVLSHLVQFIEDYKNVTVADLCDFIGITSNFTYNKVGWKDLSTAYISKVRGGYKVNLPKPRLLVYGG